MELAKLGDWLEQLYKGYLRGWTIIEHRVGSETMIGWIEHCGFDTDGRFSIDWTERKGNRFSGGTRRTTIFRPECWQVEIMLKFAFLKRIAKDPPEREPINPWSDANLYTIAFTDLYF
jgi:hypothetical protein